MAHDQLFKELLRAFFAEFLRLFLPTVAARLDLEQVAFLDNQVFTDLPQGALREPDLIAEVTSVDGAAEIVLVHVEVQRQRLSEFRFRMFEYYALLRLRYNKPVYPLVLYLSSGAGGIVKEQYDETLFDENILTFRYAAIGLPDLQADDYLDNANPLAPAMSALMKPASVGRAVQKAQSFHKAAVSDVDEARKMLLTNIIETYLPLSGADEATFRQLTTTNEEVREMLSIFEERGIEKGILRGQRVMLLKQLRVKFGELPQAVESRVQTLETEAELETLSERILTANSLAEMGLEDGNA